MGAENSPQNPEMHDPAGVEEKQLEMVPSVDHEEPPHCLSSTPTRFTKTKHGYRPVDSDRLRNNLLGAVGFLELANAGDFAANIWNDTPVPVYAIVFMAIGATVAGILSVFAFRDAALAYANTKFLRRQRKKLQDERTRRLENSLSTHDVDVFLTLTFRELGSEFINRWGMDILMGGGAVLICIGTYMAIGGANHNVWLASNILSGYLGNAPIALYGLVNFSWAMYLWIKAQAHVTAARKVMSGTRAFALVKRRSRIVQLYCTMNGLATLVGGAFSMLTATQWWAYIVLIPVILSSLVCNVLWRRKVGYTRDYATGDSSLDHDALMSTLCFADETADQLKRGQLSSLPDPAQEFSSTCLKSMLAFVDQYGLFEELSTALLANAQFTSTFCDEASDEVSLCASELALSPESMHPIIIKAAQDCLRSRGKVHFQHLERFTAEVLGISLHLSQLEASREK